MITTYHRPQTLEEALTLLNQPDTVPLGGGTLLSRPQTDSVSVVDLQRLGLDSLRASGNELQIGATCPLQSLLESEHTPAALKTALSAAQHPQRRHRRRDNRRRRRALSLCDDAVGDGRESQRHSEQRTACPEPRRRVISDWCWGVYFDKAEGVDYGDCRPAQRQIRLPVRLQDPRR
ncbi:MAG: hypothetical protein DPW15_07500 [Chloroflexi bacterium]|nr:hypothetical protein [Chloroflexota bacterium]